MAARLKERYQKDVAPQIAKEFGITNPMAVPRIQKVVINMGMGEAIANQKILDTAADELRAITGQKPVITKAKKSIASFKLRQGMPIGVVVTLRGDRMYEFLDRLVSVALQLRMIQRNVRADPDLAERLAASASDELSQSLQELRELARGIHPAVLTDRGLEPALEALAERAPLPVSLD